MCQLIIENLVLFKYPPINQYAPLTRFILVVAIIRNKLLFSDNKTTKRPESPSRSVNREQIFPSDRGISNQILELMHSINSIIHLLETQYD